MKSVYFIPTHRRVDKCIKSYVKELIFALREFGIKIPLVIVETNKDFESDNSSTVKKIQNEYRELEIIHMTVDIQEKYFTKVFEKMDKYFLESFLSSATNYGTAMNKIAVLTCSFGADSFHRRDSDTCLIFDYIKGAKKLYPIEIELECLGRTAKELNIKSKNDEIGNEKIYVVGSNYYGEWNLDVKDFAKVSFDYVYKLYELFGFPKEAIVDICNEAFQFKKTFEQIENTTLVTSVDDGLNPDCGNLSVHKIFEYLPNLPGKNTLAADYFLFDTATSLGLPALHHTRDVFHEYHSDRFDLKKKMNYWYGISKFCDYFNLYKSVFECRRDHYRTNNNIISHEIIRNIVWKIDKFKYVDKVARINKINSIANEVLKGFDNNYSEIAKNVLNNSENYIEESNSDYNNHVLLINNWSEIISRAKKNNIFDYLGDL
jgi:hypothetical protein